MTATTLPQEYLDAREDVRTAENELESARVRLEKAIGNLAHANYNFRIIASIEIQLALDDEKG